MEGVEIKTYCYIYMERLGLRKAEYTITEVPPNPFWASVGLNIELPLLEAGAVYERVSLGYLNQSFQKCCYGGVLLWLRAGV